MGLPGTLRAPTLTKLNEKSETERLAAYASPDWRAQARGELRLATGPIQWEHVIVLHSPTESSIAGRDMASLARQRDRDAFDLLMDLAVADRLATKIEIAMGNSDVPGVMKLLQLEGAVLGLSDAGAHPAQICDAVLPTDLLGNWVRGYDALPLEVAVHKLTHEPAQLMGIADRGLVSRGYFADLVVFDPAAVGPGPLRTVNDLPKGRERLLADRPTGVHHILINGIVVRQDEKTLGGAHSGRILRPN
jgi:N-acyl-D-aspartate/D-glutamate deacylase